MRVNVGTTNSGVLTLDVFGTTLDLFFGNVLVASATSTTLTQAGGVGIIDHEGYSSFTNFSALTGLSFSDSFQRSPTLPTALGAAWSNDLNGGFQINGSNQAVPVNNPANELSVASVVGANVGSADVQATIAALGSTGAAGLVVDWNGATQSGYALLVSTTQVELVKVVNGNIAATLFVQSLTTVPAATRWSCRQPARR